MKNLLILSFSLFISFQLSAQNKLYVELDGGQRSFLNMGKIGFNNFYFSNSSDKCDTLLCSEPGLIDSEIDDYKVFDKNQKEMYQIYNKAIKKSIRAIKKADKATGFVKLKVNGKTVDVKYFDYKNAGNLKMLITIA